jgi:hypothetical protein
MSIKVKILVEKFIFKSIPIDSTLEKCRKYPPLLLMEMSTQIKRERETSVDTLRPRTIQTNSGLK